MADSEDVVEIGGEVVGSGAGARGGGAVARPYLRLWFKCAQQYQRAYKSADGSAYSARCAKCMQMVRFRVGPGGTSQRSFNVSCE